MKIKYYLRGLGVGIIVTTIILTISLHGKQKDIDDFPAEEIIAKATMLGTGAGCRRTGSGRGNRTG